MKRMLELCDDPDPRVRVIAIQECNTRLWGKPAETGMADDPQHIRDVHDISHLSPEERAEVRALVARLRLLLKRPADGPVIDAEPTDNPGDNE
jgi:hypothetical protein